MIIKRDLLALRELGLCFSVWQMTDMESQLQFEEFEGRSPSELAARGGVWVGRAAALAYSSFLDVSSLRRSAAGGRSGLSRVRLALRLSSLSGHRCGERVGRLLRQRRRAAACPCLLVLDEPAFTSPANVSRPSPTRSRSLLRRFLQRDHRIGGRARRRPSALAAVGRAGAEAGRGGGRDGGAAGDGRLASWASVGWGGDVGVGSGWAPEWEWWCDCSC